MSAEVPPVNVTVAVVGEHNLPWVIDDVPPVTCTDAVVGEPKYGR
jgi:hypothetical protein